MLLSIPLLFMLCRAMNKRLYCPVASRIKQEQAWIFPAQWEK